MPVKECRRGGGKIGHDPQLFFYVYWCTMNLGFITCPNSVCLSCTHICLQGILPLQCLWLGGLAYWVWTEPKVRSIVSVTFRSHEVSCVRYLRTRYEKRIVDPLYLLAFIVSWEKINPLCCFYDCFNENETTVKQRIVSVKYFMLFWVRWTMRWLHWGVIPHLTFSDPTPNLVRQYDFPLPLRCRKTSDTGFVTFVCPLSEPVRRFFSCSTDFSQQIAQVVLFLFLYVFLF
jgi:hypothetical protein